MSPGEVRFHRALEWTTFAAALLGFTALAITGEIGPVLTVFGYGALLLSRQRHRFKRRPSEKLVTWFSIALFILCAGWVVVLAGDPLPAIVLFTTFLLGLRLFAPRAHRDLLQIHLISFGMLLLASVLTTSFFFLPICLAFGLCMLVGLVLLTIKRESETTWDAEEPARGKALGGLVDRHFLGGMSGVTVALYLLAAGFFLTLPRYQGQDWFRNLRRNTSGESSGEQVSGHGDTVALGDISEVRLDPTIVMRVMLPEIEEPGSNRPVDHLRLRGQTFSYFDGAQWYRDTRGRRTTGAQPNVLMDMAPPGDGSFVQEVYQEQGASPYFFGENRPISLLLLGQRQRNLEINERANWARLAEVERLPEAISYQVHSDPLPAEAHQSLVERYPERYSEPLEFAAGDDPDTVAERISRNFYRRRDARYRWNNVQRYASTDPWTSHAGPIRELAVRWAAEGRCTDPADIANHFVRRLHLDYEYTLNPGPVEEGEFPVARFLLETREGHCEYFATSMVLMLRALGIPARMVTGYYTQEWNSSGRFFVVRESHAHAWVEMLDPARGWLPWDPTPTDGMPTQRSINLWGRTTHWLDARRHHWYRWVIDLSQAQQRELFHAAGLPWFSARQSLADVLNRIRSVEKRLRLSDVQRIALAVVAAAFLVAAAVTLTLALKRSRTQQRRSLVGHGSPPEYYRRLVRWLRRRGHVRPLGKTPAEFACELLRDHPDWAAVPAITALYYRDRYATHTLTREERARAEELLASLMG
jgi:transglutaminase-like putative cysteine protease